MKENNTTIYGNIHFDNKWICISNHKVASTTLSCVLKKNGGFGKRDWYEVDVNQFNFIFTFVRNPYDRIVSRFLHLKRRIGEINGLIDEDETKQTHADKNLLSFFGKYNVKVDEFNFNKFVRFTQTHWDDHWESQYSKFERQLGSLSKLNFVGRYENLQNDFAKLCKMLKLEIKELLHVNKSNYQRDYVQYYDTETIKLVTDIYRKDIDYFE